MVKVIEVDGNTFKLDGNITWMMEYQEQFGHDILPDLMPIIGAVFEYMEDAAASGVSLKNAKDITNALGRGISATGPLVELASFQMTDIIRIVWAMAKTADPDIDPPKQWARKYDPFPFDVLIPEVFTLAAQSSMSSKNLNSLWSGLRSPQANGTESN